MLKYIMKNRYIATILITISLVSSFLYADTNILIFGDIYPGGRVQTNFLLKKERMDPRLLSLILRADVVIGNFECTATYEQTGADKMYLLRLFPDFSSHTEMFSLDAVTLANNHILDYGEKGMLDTIEYLKKLNIKITGAGKDINDAMKPAVLTAKNGSTVRLFGFSDITPSFFADMTTAGTCPADPHTIRIALEPYKNAEGITIVYFHFGQEYDMQVTERQKKLSRLALEYGADIVVGAHTHVVQVWEMIGGKPVFYGLGNTLFDIDHRLSTKTGLVPMITVKDNGEISADIFTIRSEPDSYMPYVFK